MHSARLIPLVTILLVLAGCATPAASLVPSGPDSPAISSPTLAVASGSPSPTLPPAAVLDPSLTCGGEERFPPSALQLPGFAEHEPGAAADALRSFLEAAAETNGMEGMDTFPLAGWHRVFESEQTVVFVARGPADMPWVIVAFDRRDAGWEFDRAGQCQAQIALPEGIGRATWWLDPELGPPGPEDMVLSAIILEQACASGQEPVGRVLPPAIVYGEEAIVITIAVRQNPGGFECPGNPLFPLTIQLDQPLGDRALLDGGVFPPRDASQPPPDL